MRHPQPRQPLFSGQIETGTVVGAPILPTDVWPTWWPALAYQIGRWLAPRTGHPALLIASRRLVDAPFSANRASSVVVLAVMLGSAVQGTHADFLTITDPTDTLYAMPSPC